MRDFFLLSVIDPRLKPSQAVIVIDGGFSPACSSSRPERSEAGPEHH